MEIEAKKDYKKDKKKAKKKKKEMLPYEDVKDEYMSGVLRRRQQHSKTLFESHKLHTGIEKVFNSV